GESDDSFHDIPLLIVINGRKGDQRHRREGRTRDGCYEPPGEETSCGWAPLQQISAVADRPARADRRGSDYILTRSQTRRCGHAVWIVRRVLQEAARVCGVPTSAR